MDFYPLNILSSATPLPQLVLILSARSARIAINLTIATLRGYVKFCCQKFVMLGVILVQNL